jgi:hypothetical protein
VYLIAIKLFKKSIRTQNILKIKEKYSKNSFRPIKTILHLNSKTNNKKSDARYIKKSNVLKCLISLRMEKC